MKLTSKQRLALYKTAAADCFRQGHKVTPELAKQSYGSIGNTPAERLDVLQQLEAHGLVETDPKFHFYRLTAAGREAINYVPATKDTPHETR